VWVTFFPVNPGQQQNAELRASRANPSGGVLTLRGSGPIGTGNNYDAHRPRRPGYVVA
jgi:hypothetical protein